MDGGADTLDGSIGADVLRGGGGQDLLSGGTQGDVFIFATAAEAGAGFGRDRITDFQAGVDDIDLSSFMAGGVFIGAAVFIIGNGPQVRFSPTTGILQGEVTGDGAVDFSLQLDGSPVLTAADFIFQPARAGGYFATRAFRVAISLSRSAFRRMKPAASFWS